MDSKYKRLPYELVKKVLQQDISSREKLSVLEELYRANLLLSAQDNFAAFCEYVLVDDKEIDKHTGRPAHIELQPFHREWCELLQEEQFLSVWAPRYSGKTNIFSIAYPLWRIGKDPNILISIVSKVGGQAKKPLSAIKQYIIHSREYQEVFPGIKPALNPQNQNKPTKWTESEILIQRTNITAKDHTLISYGLGSKAIRGSRARLIVFDDVLAFDGKHISDAEMEAGIAFFEDVAKFCIEEHAGDQIVVNGTPARAGDLLHHLETKTRWKTVKYSYEEQDVQSGYKQVQWASKFPEHILEQEKIDDLISYNRNRRCVVRSSDELLFKEALKTVVQQDWDILETGKWSKYMGMDLSTAKRKGTAINVIAVRPDFQQKVVLDVDVGAWEPDTKSRKIRDYGNNYKPQLIYVENNALQDDVVKLLIASGNRHLPIKPYTTGSAKHGALDSMAIEVLNGLWRFNLSKCAEKLVLTGKTNCKDSNCKWCRFVNEVMNYPNYTTTDMLMGWMFASEASAKVQGQDIQIYTINLNTGYENQSSAFASKKRTTAEEALFNPKKPTFGFKDYYYGNAVTRDYNLQLSDKTQEERTYKQDAEAIIKYVKMRLKYEEIKKGEWKKDKAEILKDKSFSPLLFDTILHDMMEYCSRMNGDTYTKSNRLKAGL